MGLLDIIKLPFQGIIDSAGKIIDDIVTTDEERLAARIKLQDLLQNFAREQELTLRKELEAKERIIVAELEQKDKFTKRARPSVIYSGIVFIFLNYVLFPMLTVFFRIDAPKLELPTEFWIAWGGIVATYNIARTVDKRGDKNNKLSKIAKMIVG